MIKWTKYKSVEELPTKVGDCIGLDGTAGPIITHRMMIDGKVILVCKDRDRREIIGFVRGQNRTFRVSYELNSLTPDNDLREALKSVFNIIR